jgi:hypothetical protein
MAERNAVVARFNYRVTVPDGSMAEARGFGVQVEVAGVERSAAAVVAAGRVRNDDVTM